MFVHISCRFAATLVFLGALNIETAARASTTCTQTPQGPDCISQVDFNQFAQTAFMTQAEDEWCWAASISMIFSFYGHPVSQSRIVSAVYGGAVDAPAQDGAVIACELNRDWTDDNGHTFSSQVTGAFDAEAGIDNLSNQQLLSELDQNHPIIMGAQGHATVLTALEYLQTQQGPDIFAGGVFDPWPGRGARGLSTAELTPVQGGGTLAFVATVRISDTTSGADPQCGSKPFNPTSSNHSANGCQSLGSTGPAVLVALLLIAVRPVRRRE